MLSSSPMNPHKTVLVISKDIVLTSIIGKIVHDTVNLLPFSDFKSALDFIYNSQPDLLILDLAEDAVSNVSILNDLKSDPIFGQIPAVIIFADDFDIPSWECLLADDYIRRSAVEDELGKSRIVFF